MTIALSKEEISEIISKMDIHAKAEERKTKQTFIIKELIRAWDKVHVENDIEGGSGTMMNLNWLFQELKMVTPQ
jgi:hypothetical protein